MGKPVAFHDEQLDADLRDILGTWSSEEQAATAINNTIQLARPTFKNNINAEDGASSPRHDVSATIKFETVERGHHELAPFGKASISLYSSRLKLAIAGTMVAITGLALLGVTADLLGGRAPSQLQKERTAREVSTRTSNSIVNNVATDEPVVVPIIKNVPPTQGQRVAMIDLPPAQKPALVRVLELDRPKRRHKPLSTQATSGSNIVVRKHPLVEIMQSPVEASSTTALQSSNVPEPSAREVELAASADGVTKARERRDSVAALRSLRRQ